MARRFALRPTAFAVAAAIAASCVLAAMAVLIVAPVAPVDGGAYASLERAWLQALSGAAGVALAVWLRARQEATAYALLAAACLLAAWATETIWQNSLAAGSALPLADLVFRLALVPATTAVISVFASTPERRVGRLEPPILALLVAVTIAAAVARTWLDASGSEFSGFADALTNSWGMTSLLPAGVPLVAAMAGSLRIEARRLVHGASPSSAHAPFSRSLGHLLAAGIGIGLVTAGTWLQSDAASSGTTLLPLLAAFIAVVAARWSAFVAWVTLAISFGISAALGVAGAVELEVPRIVEDPAAAATPSSIWFVALTFAALVAGLATWAGSNALQAARRSIGGRRERVTVRPAVLTAITFGIAAWATLVSFAPPGKISYPLLELPLWTVFSVLSALSGLLFVGGLEAARARLVPAVAEAEAVARHPFRPFRYLEVVVLEALAGRAALRRSAAAAERAKLASDLHAEILPSLAEIAARYESGSPSEDVAARLRQLEAEVRDLMAERRLVVLEEFGIVEAIEWLVGRAEERASMEVQLSVDDRTTEGRPPREVERAGFRIAQLAIENALQHAAPTRLELEVLSRADEVRISVVDDGRGFARPRHDRTRDHLGISDMRSQAAGVHGDVQVVSPPTGGTVVTFAWPAA